MANGEKIKRMCILVGGGPAPGINGVISAATIEALNRGVEVYGIQNGNNWIMKGVDELIKLSGGKPEEVTDLAGWITAGKCKYVRRLYLEDVVRVPFKGGSILGTSRANPTKDPKAMARVIDFYKQLRADGLVSIGGDDTAYSASQVYAAGKGSIRVAHVPKTIDNDLPLPGGAPTFGFDTARAVGAQLVRNLAEDARTTSRWYIIVSMGRAAGHLALGIGKASAATLTVIPEEFPKDKKISLDTLCDVVIGAIVKRLALDRSYGVVVLAEGLIEKLDEAELSRTIGEANGAYGEVVLDPFGHLRLGEIEFGRMMREMIAERLKPLAIKTTFIDKELGYELRCADPTPFDCDYTRDLGYGAVKFLRSHESDQFGAVVAYDHGKLDPQPFEKMLDAKSHKMQTREVDVQAASYECARHYMTRLERADFADPVQLAKLASVVGLSPEAFRRRFER